MNKGEMSCNIAFKEWGVVCDYLAAGRQHLIFRKGGIHEGRDGFSFKHDTFALFPTRFHTKPEHVTVPCSVAEPKLIIGEEILIEYVAIAEWAKTLTDWSEVLALSDYHIYSEETLSDRFYWEGKGMERGSVHVAFVRIYRLPEALKFSYQKSHGGCRSWIEIPNYDFSSLRPVVDDESFEEIYRVLA